MDEANEQIVLDLFKNLHEQGTTIIVVTHDSTVAGQAQREIMLNHGKLVGEKWNDPTAKSEFEALAASDSRVAVSDTDESEFVDPTKSAKDTISRDNFEQKD